MKKYIIVSLLSLFVLVTTQSYSYTVVGGLISGATGLDSEYTTWTSTTNPGTWIDCTNEAVEIGSSGAYYLELTAAEMDAAYIAVQIKSTEADTVIFYINTSSAWLGNGDVATTINLVDSSAAAIASANIKIMNTDEDVTYARTTSDASGQAVFALEAGDYSVILSDYGSHVWTVPETLTVASTATSDTYVGTAFDPGTPTTASVCRVWGYVYNPDGSAKSGETVKAKLRPQDYPAAYDSDGDGSVDSGIFFAITGGSTTTSSAGYWYLDLTYSAKVLHLPGESATKYRITVGEAGITHDVTVPSSASSRLDALTFTER